MIRKALALATAVSALALFTSCADEKTPAEAALKAAEAAVAGVKDEAAKYAPDQLKAVTSALAGATEAFKAGKYKDAMAAASAIPAKVKDVAAAAAAKKDELTKAFATLEGSLPKMGEAIKSRLDILSQAKKLPAGLDAAKLTEAKSGYEALTKGWVEAKAAFKGGNLTDAVAKGNALKAKGTELMKAIGLQ
jgi:hypothetical protein